MSDLQLENLNKNEFLRVNHEYIKNLLRTINDELLHEYQPRYVDVKLVDVWVITYAETGIDTQGHIASHYQHSNGEIGMYPLPKNIKDWNGPAAPTYNEPHKIEINVEHYFKYIGHLKNKVVKHINDTALYRDLFDQSGTKNEKDALILAGVIHGYFYSGNYDDNLVPLQHLIDGFEKELALPDLLRNTSYKHADTSIIENRAKNLKKALIDFNNL